MAEFPARVACTEDKVEEELRKANARDDRLKDYSSDRPCHDIPILSERLVREGNERDPKSTRGLGVYESDFKHDVPRDARIIGSRWLLRRKGALCEVRLVVAESAKIPATRKMLAPTPSLS